MKIEQLKVTIRQLVKGYENLEDEGVCGYGGQLDIRPAYQREFVYEEPAQIAVVDSVLKGFPLNAMYWVKQGKGYEVLDGQQRTISIGEYYNSEFSVLDRNKNPLYYSNLSPAEKKSFLDYPLMVYVCEGDHREKLDWFRVINIAGLELREQERRNAIYAGRWVASARRYFSKQNCLAKGLGDNYMKGDHRRQDYLETAIEWFKMTQDPKESIDDFMARHHKNNDADDLWKHFESVMKWVKTTFREPRPKFMKGQNWGKFYLDHRQRDDLEPNDLERRIRELLENEYVDRPSGIYEYLLTGNEKCLKIRAFSGKMKSAAYARQEKKCANKRCPHGGREFALEEMHGDHIVPWAEGGPTTAENLQMLCRECNWDKGRGRN